MTVIVSMLLLEFGAFLHFIAPRRAGNFNLELTGTVLIVVGAIGVISAIARWSSWGGSWARRMSVVRTDGGTRRTRTR